MNKKEHAEGILPSDAWLIKNGYGKLVKIMEEYPEMFAHIKKNRKVENKENYNGS